MEPCQEEFIFENKIKGGVISSKYFPSIEKAAKDIMKSDAAFNYPIYGVKEEKRGPKSLIIKQILEFHFFLI